MSDQWERDWDRLIRMQDKSECVDCITDEYGQHHYDCQTNWTDDDIEEDE